LETRGNILDYKVHLKIVPRGVACSKNAGVSDALWPKTPGVNYFDSSSKVRNGVYLTPTISVPTKVDGAQLCWGYEADGFYKPLQAGLRPIKVETPRDCVGHWETFSEDCGCRKTKSNAVWKFIGERLEGQYTQYRVTVPKEDSGVACNHADGFKTGRDPSCGGRVQIKTEPQSAYSKGVLNEPICTIDGIAFNGHWVQQLCPWMPDNYKGKMPCAVETARDYGCYIPYSFTYQSSIPRGDGITPAEQTWCNKKPGCQSKKGSKQYRKRKSHVSGRCQKNCFATKYHFYTHCAGNDSNKKDYPASTLPHEFLNLFWKSEQSYWDLLQPALYQ